MQRKVVAPLLVALIVCVMVLVTGCTKKNHSPVLGAITATPADSVAPGGNITLKVTATDEDNDSLTFAWTKTAGTLSATTGDSVVWTAPTAPATCTLTVICTDGADGADTATKVVRARAWLTGNADVVNDDSVFLPAVGTATSVIDLTDSIPTGALVDSMRLTLAVDPDTLDGIYVKVWLLSPTDSVLVWDQRDANLDIDDELVAGFTDKAAKGKWTVKVVRNDPTGGDANIDSYNADVYYRY
jgi:hypothetical protein